LKRNQDDVLIVAGDWSGGLMALDPKLVLSQVRETLDNAPDAKALREVRATLDDPAFFFELSEYLRDVNDADTKAEILSDINAISRHCSDKTAQRKNELTNTRYGIGAGCALTASGLIGLAAGAPILLIVAFAGGWIAAISLSKTGPLSAEEQIYQDIASRAMKIREKFDAA
jgi:hypothetical protein